MDKSELIAGPGESEESFRKRCEADPLIVEYAPLPFWQGGYCESGPEGVRLVLSTRFETKESFLFYSKSELIAHERVHALRAAFDEPRFEEILAYRTATSRFRRYFGPLFRKPWETTAFLGGVFVTSVLNFFSPLYMLLLGTVMGVLFLRLVRDQRIFAKMCSHLAKVVDEAERMALHLTDGEIALFARSTPEEIREYWAEQKCLRWKQISDLFSCASLRSCRRRSS